MESQSTSVEPGPRGEPGEESATETSLPLGYDLQELPSRFQRGQTFRAARFVRIDTAIQAVARGLRIALQDHGPCFIQNPRQATQPGEEPPDESVVDDRLVRRRRGRRAGFWCGERIADQAPVMPHALAIRDNLSVPRIARALDTKQGVANRLYGSTKVGVVGERPTAVDAPPTRQHNPHANHGRADDVSQLARPQFMRSEAIRFCADGTTVPVTDSVSGIRRTAALCSWIFSARFTILPMYLDSWSEARTIRPRSFFMRPKNSPPRATTRGGVRDVIYRSGVESGIAAG